MKTCPHQQGLYDPAMEKDACGVGFVANIKGVKTHAIVEQGIQVVENLSHRGACGCDPLTGDGAGLLIQIPHDFFVKEMKGKFALPEPGQYGAGLVFLPQKKDEREKCLQIFEKVIKAEGQTFLGWRDVPTSDKHIGYVAKAAEPLMKQVFVGAAKGLAGDAFERKLYVIRRQVENQVKAAKLSEQKCFYVTHLSSRVLVYKGQLIAHQVHPYFPDLADPTMKSALALVHQRYSTNTFPSWDLAHPFRYIAHNGEINTLRGNINWMHTRESLLKSPLFGADLKKLFPVVQEGGSDSAIFDNVLEMLVMAGRSLPHAILMLIPEAWKGHEAMDDEKKAFYEYHGCLMEPWDGPASIAFTDGRIIGAILDRNGLRPSRYIVTKDDFVVMASEVGVLQIPEEKVVSKGRLQPGKMFLVDTEKGRIISDDEIKTELKTRQPYAKWLKNNLVRFTDLPRPPQVHNIQSDGFLPRQIAFGYTEEELKMLIAPMAYGEEAVGSMGTDTPLAVLSNKPQLLFHYFKQLFAQVTNPPIDPIREEVVMSMESTLGPEGNLFDETPEQCHQLKLPHPIITNRELEKIRHINEGKLRATTLSMVWPVSEGVGGMKTALDRLCAEASKAIKDGFSILILSDRGLDPNHAAIPSLLATAAVHHHLIREETRTRVGLVVESGEPREMHHFALLIGYGAGAINPYMALESVAMLVGDGIHLKDLDLFGAINKFIKSTQKGLLKIISKMGISTIQSYRGAQIFEALGLNDSVVSRYFTGTASRIGGIGLEIIAEEALLRHGQAYPKIPVGEPKLDLGGQYHWRREGEQHLFNPTTISLLQQSVRSGSYATFKDYSKAVNDQSEKNVTLRSLLDFQFAEKPIPLEDVEPAKDIVKRFCTGAMSFGSISREAHETLAIAMNRIGGKSNTGEGGEDAGRFAPDAQGNLRRSKIKQVASARFGVTSHYLTNADELQIKMAQGAKPGEGGQLPGHKVSEEIARVRYSVPGVTLISPPPHHDIYSIEDLAQLIHDLKCGNPKADVSVKLVAEVGVGTVAAGVSKGKAEGVLISGHDGGTGASPLTSIKHAGLPWELGLAETQQVLVLNDLRGRIRVQTDGQLKTGRDVVVAALLGAEEFGFASAPLVSMGCIMMRKCHLNTCPVGVATQDPELRRKFAGTPENVVNFFFYIAEEMRELMSQLGFRTVAEMIGRSDRLKPKAGIKHWKARYLNFANILYRPEAAPNVQIHNVIKQDHGLQDALDYKLMPQAEPALAQKKRVEIETPIRNIDRTFGAILSHEISKRHGVNGLPDDTITIRLKGSAGQSFGCWLAPGITLKLEGDANDYIGKGLSGGRIAVFPAKNISFKPEENMIIGNVALYGAIRGEVFFRGLAGERFCVRNSGAHAVVEGVGDHGCEYMTGGQVVVIGPTGRNFAAGMSGGIAYVLDENKTFDNHCNKGMVALEPLKDSEDVALVKGLLAKHAAMTGSPRAEAILKAWGAWQTKFVKVFPDEYRRALKELAETKVTERADSMSFVVESSANGTPTTPSTKTHG